MKKKQKCFDESQTQVPDINSISVKHFIQFKLNVCFTSGKLFHYKVTFYCIDNNLDNKQTFSRWLKKCTTNSCGRESRQS